MDFVLANRIKAIVAFKLLDHWLADSYSLNRFQVIRFVLVDRIKAVLPFKLLDHWLAESYSLPRFQVMCFS